ncbi:hypothetical protein RaK2_00368 [Klebsiella phage vB_KleM_RaK2]|uniref:Uncharacterized protein n=1 Tax=Klebsiella phage vB_KleM_RaK2 TaxID=1147094 RepID=H6X4H5_9CAUD|nr:hypothetical protein F403_gp167 [Klebsiella phage vB_KleM_RaK2]AFA44641.1 hypothetical protein RaK2_00368 [Klebsiella phage vB_KleM_RaK2]
MTKDEYKSVSIIQKICVSIYRNTEYGTAMRSVLNMLSKDFTHKYHGRKIKIININGEYYTKIKKYKITLGECVFRTKSGVNGLFFGNYTMLCD